MDTNWMKMLQLVCCHLENLCRKSVAVIVCVGVFGSVQVSYLKLKIIVFGIQLLYMSQKYRIPIHPPTNF